jgi:peptidoglycan-associated lipoprotein
MPSPAAAPVQGPSVHVSDDILSACQTDDAQVGDTPLFAFDSAALSRADRHLLQEVAACVTVGPLAGHTLKLVGRADPRGTEGYNLHLGDRRALSVAGYLERHGVAANKLIETSRGALDAKGHDESGWQKDRRVDVDLAI